MDTTIRQTTLRGALRVAAATLTILAAMSPASAEPLRFGEHAIDVPAPAGFIAASTLKSSLIRYHEGFMAPSDRLVEIYVAQADVPRVERGSLGKFDRSFQLHVQRARDGELTSRAEFAELAAGIDEELAGLEAQLDELRNAHFWVRSGATTLVRDEKGRLRWWTFAGLLANAWLGTALRSLRTEVSARDNLTVTLDPSVTVDALREAASATDLDEVSLSDAVVPEAIDGLKFSECLPREMAIRVVSARLDDRRNARAALQETIHSAVLA